MDPDCFSSHGASCEPSWPMPFVPFAEWFDLASAVPRQTRGVCRRLRRIAQQNEAPGWSGLRLWCGRLLRDAGVEAESRDAGDLRKALLELALGIVGGARGEPRQDVRASQ